MVLFRPNDVTFVYTHAMATKHESGEVISHINNGESLKVLQKIEDGKFDLVLTSPPLQCRQRVRNADEH